MGGRRWIERPTGDKDSTEATGSRVPDVEVEQDVVVRLFPREFHWVEVDAEYLGPARPRIPRELAGVDE